MKQSWRICRIGGPKIWHERMSSFTREDLDVDQVIEKVNSLELKDEVVHFGRLGIFWGKFSEESYYATAYHKHLLKMPFYCNITIRNAKTFDKIGQMLKNNKGDTQ